MNTDKCQCFAAAVRQQRLSMGLSQEVLAHRAGIHHTHVGLIERGERIPSLDIAFRIAEALGSSIDQLVGSSSAKKGRE